MKSKQQQQQQQNGILKMKNGEKCVLNAAVPKDETGFITATLKIVAMCGLFMIFNM